MARVSIPELGRQIEEVGEIVEFLGRYGIGYERWAVEGRLGAEATGEEILRAYAVEVEAVSRRGGYRAADVIEVTPETPGLEAMLNRFNKEHTHADDEVRFIVKGRGLFHIHPGNGDPTFALEVEAGDLINVPEGTRHWFDLCGERRVRAIRLFKDPAGWAPAYVEGGVHGRFEPVCWGPAYVGGAAAVALIDPLAT